MPRRYYPPQDRHRTSHCYAEGVFHVPMPPRAHRSALTDRDDRLSGAAGRSGRDTARVADARHRRSHPHKRRHISATGPHRSPRRWGRRLSPCRSRSRVARSSRLSAAACSRQRRHPRSRSPARIYSSEVRERFTGDVDPRPGRADAGWAGHAPHHFNSRRPVRDGWASDEGRGCERGGAGAGARRRAAARSRAGPPQPQPQVARVIDLDADDVGAARSRAGDAGAAAQGARAREGRGIRALVDSAGRAHDRSARSEDWRLDHGHHLQPLPISTSRTFSSTTRSSSPARRGRFSTIPPTRQ